MQRMSCKKFWNLLGWCRKGYSDIQDWLDEQLWGAEKHKRNVVCSVENVKDMIHIARFRGSPYQLRVHFNCALPLEENVQIVFTHPMGIYIMQSCRPDFYGLLASGIHRPVAETRPLAP